MPEHAKSDADSKVVHLEPESQRIVRAKLARLPAAVHAVHEKGKLLVLNLMGGFFERVDDSLFELADKAQSNQEQNLYFDSMREVRVQRRDIEKRFADAIDFAFVGLVSPETASEHHSGFGTDTLSLVEHDELDQMVASDTAIARANKDHGEAIQLISLRMDSLVPVKVYQKNNPLGPDVLCATFGDEIKKLDVGIKAKLVLFKLFEKSVLSRLGEVYGPVNEVLLDHNILPSLSRARGVNRSGGQGFVQPNAMSLSEPSSLEASPTANATAGNVNPEVLTTLKSMLGERVVDNPQAPSKTQVAANELIQLLSRVQHMPAVMNNEVALNVRALIGQLQQKTGVSANIGQVDDQVMNLVNMLFDFILEDRNLASPMKALLSRMQIPIIKVAVADKSFFTQGGHVARRLLNEMATAAMGWTGDHDSCQGDPLYKKIESVVRRLIDDFDTDLAIFDELLADFSAFLEKEKKRAAVLERRTIDAEDGKAKAEVARTTVDIEVEIRTVGMALPQVVNDLVKDAWSNVLFVTALKYGYEAQEWQNQLLVLEDLVWSVQPPKSAEQRQKLIKLVPGLLKRLRSGLDTISFNPFEMSDLFKSLEKVHIACIRGKAAQRPAPAKQPVTPENKVQSEAVESDLSAVAAPIPPQEASSAKPDSKRPVPKPVSAKKDTHTEAQALGIPEPSLHDLARGVELAELDEVDRLLGQPAPVKPASGPTSLPSDDPYMKQVSLFSQGTWFDMQNGRGENVRSRLAAVIKPTGKYIFVNRNGMKVAEHTQVELALMLKNNSLRSLDDSMLFDRALETVVTGLRKA